MEEGYEGGGGLGYAYISGEVEICRNGVLTISRIEISGKFQILILDV